MFYTVGGVPVLEEKHTRPNAAERAELPENYLKQFNYAEQMKRLKKALSMEFYLEATFIEYAVIEDRIESFLRHAGVFNPKKHNSLNGKLSKLAEQQRCKTGLIRKYVSDELIASIHSWKNERNILTHAMMKNNLTTEHLKKLAEDGEQIVKILNSKSTSYRRYLERHKEEK